MSKKFAFFNLIRYAYFTFLLFEIFVGLGRMLFQSDTRGIIGISTLECKPTRTVSCQSYFSPPFPRQAIDRLEEVEVEALKLIRVDINWFLWSFLRRSDSKPDVNWMLKIGNAVISTGDPLWRD